MCVLEMKSVAQFTSTAPTGYFQLEVVRLP